MTDPERRAHALDRRKLLPRLNPGRRATDPPPSHGTRACYQAGCRLTLCKAANARYVADLRRQHAHGHQPMGTRVSAQETWRLIEKMLIERFKRAEIARALGLKRGRLEFHTSAVTMRTRLNVRRLYRLRMLGEGPDQPHV